MKPFVGVASASSKPRSASNSQEPSASSSSAKVNGATFNVHVGADSRKLVASCGRALANKENAGVTAIPERTDVKPPLAKGGVKDEELYSLVEFRTKQGTETMLVHSRRRLECSLPRGR